MGLPSLISAITNGLGTDQKQSCLVGFGRQVTGKDCPCGKRRQRCCRIKQNSCDAQYTKPPHISATDVLDQHSIIITAVAPAARGQATAPVLFNEPG